MNMNDFTPDNAINTSQVSPYQIISDPQVRQILVDYGWTTEPDNKGMDMYFYNKSYNAALKITPGGATFVSLSIISLAHPSLDCLSGPRMCSSLADARGFIHSGVSMFSAYNPYNNASDVNTLAGNAGGYN